MSHYIIQSGKKSVVQTDFAPNLELDGPYEIALQSLETYYSFPNIDKKNNTIRVTLDGTTWYDLKFAVGCYEYKDINKELQRQIKSLGGKETDIILHPNKNTFQTIMIIQGTVQVDFVTCPNPIRTVLGFDKKVYGKGRHISEHTVNIMRVNSIFVHTNVIASSYVNGSQSPVIYSFFPDIPPGAKIIVQPRVLIYLPVSLSVISRLTSWLTDQDNTPLNSRGEELTIKYHLRPCTNR